MSKMFRKTDLVESAAWYWFCYLFYELLPEKRQKYYLIGRAHCHDDVRTSELGSSWKLCFFLRILLCPSKSTTNKILVLSILYHKLAS